MVFGLFSKKNNNRAIIDRQYSLLTEAARQPDFYLHLQAPDTVMGRFEMLSVVLILYFRRTAKSDRAAQEIAQEIIDTFFEDLDHSIRELGIGDLGVPKRMKKLAGMFYGRLESYAKALENQDMAELSDALRRNFHPEAASQPVAMDGLARYMLAAEASLGVVSEETIETGNVKMPTPEPELSNGPSQ